MQTLHCWQESYTDFSSKINHAGLRAARDISTLDVIQTKHWDDYRALLEQFKSCSPLRTSRELNQEVITAQIDANADQLAKLSKMVERLIPWRTGPFCIENKGEQESSIKIDAEWRSNMKWDRIAAHLGEIQGKRIVDIGGNAGYFLFRLLDQNPELALCFDPSSRCYYQFDLIRRLIDSEQHQDRLGYEPLGIEHMSLFDQFFHTVICMGVLYHNKSPLRALERVRGALVPGGKLILESMAIPGDDAVALFPEDRYAKMRNCWFIPTASCLKLWVQRAGFENVEIISSVKSETEEQRQTKLAPYESLKDFLDPNDSEKTIEGHPAPWRVIVTGNRKV